MRRTERSTRAAAVRLGLAAVAVAALPAAPAGAAPGYPASEAVTFRTVPPVAGARLRTGGRIVTTDAAGQVTVSVRRTGPRIRDIEAPEVLPTQLTSGPLVRFDGFFDSGRTIGLALYTRTRLRYADPAGKPVPARRVAGARLVSGTGVRVRVRGAVTPQLRANHVALTRDGVRSRPVQYAVERVEVDGGNVVNRAQQRFYPLSTRAVRVPLLLYALRFTARDALLGRRTGTAVELRYPNGRTVRITLRDGRAAVAGLPRGEYSVRVEASGYSAERPVWLSGDQAVDLQVVSPIDMAVVLGGLASVAVALLLVGRPALRRRLVRR
jgi:hypothetical protein